MRLCLWLPILVWICSTICRTEQSISNNIWRETGRRMGIFIQHCFHSFPESFQDAVIMLQDCLKRRSLRAIDKAADMDVIEIFNGVAFVRDNKTKDNQGNGRSLLLQENSSNNNKTEDWKSRITHRVFQLFDTHVLKIQLKSLDDASSEVEGRGRRKGMFTQLMMFGMIAAAFIVIPMGFQFLAILGGKALLLAKMALLLSSIQGLKKIATSNYNYGLYSYGGGPCKNQFDYGCNERFFDEYSFEDNNKLYYNRNDEGDVVITVHIDGPEGQYDRQWPYNGETQGYGNYNGNAENIYPRTDR